MTTQHTPAATWRENGEPDPHAGHYDMERHDLTMGYLTDDEVANAVYLHGDSAYHKPSLGSLLAGDGHTSGYYLQAAKDRIRWLSRRLVKAEQQRDECVAMNIKQVSTIQELMQQNADLLAALKLAIKYITQNVDNPDIFAKEGKEGMTISDRLREYNNWRHGDETISHPNPKELWQLIDAAADRIDALEKEHKSKGGANEAR